MLKKIDHIGIVVKNLDEALDLYVRSFGFQVSDIQVAEKGEKFRTAMVSFGDVTFELIEPIDDRGGIRNFLETRGEGIHHVSLEVDDIRKEMSSLAAKGLKCLMKEPEEVMGTLVTFVHPKSTRGVLVELLQKG